MTEIEKAIKLIDESIENHKENLKETTNNPQRKQMIEESLKSLEVSKEACEKQMKIYSTLHSLEEIVARNIIAWETSKDKLQGLLPEIYLIDRALFTQLTGLEPTIPNLKKYMTY